MAYNMMREKNRLSVIFGIIFFLCTPEDALSEKSALLGFIRVPVADLFKSPLQDLWPHRALDDAYRSIPHSIALGKNYPLEFLAACPRANQYLFNTIVIIAEKKGKEIRICSPALFSVEDDHSIKQTCYWTHEDNVMTFQGLAKNAINPEQIIPPAIDFVNPQTLYNKNVVTLTRPFCHPKTHEIFSAGTRFMRSVVGSDNNCMAVFCMNAKQCTVDRVLIPKNSCIVGAPEIPTDSMSLFLQLLRQWAHPSEGSIPYVWGGSSIVDFCDPEQFERQSMFLSDKHLEFFVRTHNQEYPRTGLDCSCMITRAAHIAGIPYFYKDSHTLAQYLDALKSGERIEEGDLIWYPGHVIIISDVEHAFAIEACSYDPGYGTVHEIPLNKLFADVSTYDELRLLHDNGGQLKRLDKWGKVMSIKSHFKIFKMSSAWHCYRCLRNKKAEPS